MAARCWTRSRHCSTGRTSSGTWAGIYAAPRGARGWPPPALFRAMLLATWHDLSDVKLAEALADRASFRRFCGFAAAGPTPERTAFVRLRAELVGRGLDRVLFEAITGQLAAKEVAVRTGTLVDATLIGSASIRRDGEARWAGHRRRKPVHGDKAHVATDAAGGLILGTLSRARYTRRPPPHRGLAAAPPRHLRASSGPRSPLDHRPDFRGQRVQRERFRQHLHPRREQPVAERGVVRIAGDEQHFQPGPPLARRLGELAPVHARQPDIGDQQIDPDFRLHDAQP